MRDGQHFACAPTPASQSATAVQVLKMIDEYDLYGSVAYPKAHSQVRQHTSIS